MIFFPSQGFCREIEEFERGKVSSFMTLFWIAISGQVFSIGSVGLVYKRIFRSVIVVIF